MASCLTWRFGHLQLQFTDKVARHVFFHFNELGGRKLLKIAAGADRVAPFSDDHQPERFSRRAEEDYHEHSGSRDV